MLHGQGRGRDRDQPVSRVRPAEQLGRVELGRVELGRIELARIELCRAVWARAIGGHLVADEQSGRVISRLRVVEHRDHRAAVAPGVGQPLEDHHHGRVTGRAVAAQRTQRRLVHRLAGEVHGPDDRGVGLAAAQRAGGLSQCNQPGRFLGRDRVAGAPEVQLHVDPVGHQVRHRAEHGRTGELRFRPVPARRRVPGHLGIDAHADDDRGPFAGQPDLGRGLPGRFEQEHVLSVRGLEVARGEAQAVQPDVDGRARARMPLAEQDRPPEVVRVVAVSDPGADRGDGHRSVRARRPAGRGNARTGDPFVDNQMRVGAAEAEGAHRAPARARPVLRLGQQSQRGALERRDRVICAQRGRAHPGPDGAEHLQQPRAPRGGEQMPDVGFHRADRQIVAVSEHSRHAARLHRVPDGRAGRVTLHQRHGPRREAGRGVGEPHRAFLPFLGRHEQAARPAVVGQPDRPDDAEDRCPGADRVSQPHQGHQGGALTGHEPVGTAVEGPGLPGPADRPKLAEPAVHERAVRAADSPGEHEAGRTVIQPVAAELDRVQR